MHTKDAKHFVYYIRYDYRYIYFHSAFDKSEHLCDAQVADRIYVVFRTLQTHLIFVYINLKLNCYIIADIILVYLGSFSKSLAIKS